MTINIKMKIEKSFRNQITVITALGSAYCPEVLKMSWVIASYNILEYT